MLHKYDSDEIMSLYKRTDQKCNDDKSTNIDIDKLIDTTQKTQRSLSPSYLSTLKGKYRLDKNDFSLSCPYQDMH